jgi:hypothetical protein
VQKAIEQQLQPNQTLPPDICWFSTSKDINLCKQIYRKIEMLSFADRETLKYIQLH